MMDEGNTAFVHRPPSTVHRLPSFVPKKELIVKNRPGRIIVLVILLAVVGLSAMSTQASPSAGPQVKALKSDENNIDWATDAQKMAAGEPLVRYPARSDISRPVRDYPARITPKDRPEDNEHPRIVRPDPGQPLPPGSEDGTRQTVAGPLAMPTPSASFEGMYNLNGYIPPDTNGDIGRDQYVQTVNSTFQVFSRTGASLYGPANINTIWTGFGGRCEIDNDGDPIALYDPMAGRWLISQFSTTTPSHQCIAISASEDATGTYYRYDFVSGPTPSAFEDYPHFGVWPDAYYMASNEFGGPFNGGNFAFERDRMLQGDPTARMVFFGTSDGGLLPSDMDGAAPPAGSPNYFVTYPNFSSLSLYKFHVDWTNTSNSTFTGPTNIPVTPFTTGIGTVPQLGTSVRVDALNDRLMYRLAYRNFGTHESLALNYTIDTGSTVGVRWYELRNPNGTPTVFQEGTYSPADGIFRWMGSIAMDRQGNMSLGFSASSSTIYPDIRYAGRLVGDPAGQMAQGEAVLMPGGGAETNAAAARWGDYSMLGVDPVDDCTFWFTTEYFAQTGPRNWRTRIGAWKFPGCTGGTSTPVPTATGVYPSPTTPPATATPCTGYVSYTGTITNTDPTQTHRINRAHPPSSCAAPNTGAVNSDGFVRHYDQYTYTNSTGTTQCVTIRVTNACGDNTTASAAYLNTFNPGNLTQNYLGDYGELGGPQYSYSVNLPAGQTLVVVVHELSPNLGCASYTVEINPCGPLGPTATRTATSQVTSTSTSQATNTPPPLATQPPTETATTQPPTATATACTLMFTDVPTDHTFYENIRCLACRGIINGYSSGCQTGNPCFKPGNNVTRGQLAKIVSNSAGFSDPAGPQQFEDVPVGSTFFDYIWRLAFRGIVTGYPCGGPGEPCIAPDNRPYFRPNADVTRGQLSKIVAEAAGLTQPAGAQQFEDVPPGHTFYPYIWRLTSLGIMQGYPCGGEGEPCNPPGNLPYFRPGKNATRGQASKIVANTFFPECKTPAR
jgi:hypothetical protein